MRFLPAKSPTSSTSECSIVSVSISRKVLGCQNLILALEGIFVGYSSDSHSYRIYSKSTGLVIETCNVRFDEDNGSYVGQSGVHDADDEIPPQAIRRMGVGFFRPIE
jgi:hypothetical protein